MLSVEVDQNNAKKNTNIDNRSDGYRILILFYYLQTTKMYLFC